LIPQDVSLDMLGRATQNSQALRLARRLRDMPTATRTMPVQSAMATAYFVNGRTGLKQTTQVDWTDKTLTAEELAVIVPIPQSTYDDLVQGFDVWGAVRRDIEEAMGVAIDQAVLYGTNIPAAWASALGGNAGEGIVDVAAAKTSTPGTHVISLVNYGDVYDAIMGEEGVFALIEEDGFVATGVLAHTTMKGRLRGLRDDNKQPIFMASMQQAGQYVLDGVPVTFPTNGALDSAASLLIAGQWPELVYAVRQDVNWMIAKEASIHDANGTLVYNLFQQDMIALRVTFRLAVALPNPINRQEQTAGARFPFAVLTA
jgi:HK97 family phage major capsid protein